MVATVGKKLQIAREKKGLSIDQVARETKIRPERVADLENDDFTQFPNLTYAKGFLLIYAKFLGVDVSDFASSFENTSPISVSDYEYLSNAAAATEETIRTQKPVAYSAPSSGSKSIFGMLGLGVLVLFGAGLIMFWNVTSKRLAPALPAGVATPSASPSISPPIAESDKSLLQAPTPVPTPMPVASAPIATPVPLVPGPTPRLAGAPEVRRAEPVAHSGAAAQPTPAPMLVPFNSKELVVKFVRRTWIQIQRDDEHSPPVFEDWRIPAEGPITEHGGKFWIEVRDPSAVRITLDGKPVPVTGNKIVIQ